MTITSSTTIIININCSPARWKGQRDEEDVMEKKEGAPCTRSKKRRDELSAQGWNNPWFAHFVLQDETFILRSRDCGRKGEVSNQDEGRKLIVWGVIDF